MFCVLSDAAVNSGELWFVNFYSPGCSHCHDLAPTVRMLNVPAAKAFFLVDVFIIWASFFPSLLEIILC